MLMNELYEMLDERVNNFNVQHSKEIQIEFFKQITQEKIDSVIEECRNSNGNHGSVERLKFSYKNFFCIDFKFDGRKIGKDAPEKQICLLDVCTEVISSPDNINGELEIEPYPESEITPSSLFIAIIYGLRGKPSVLETVINDYFFNIAFDEEDLITDALENLRKMLEKQPTTIENEYHIDFLNSLLKE